MIYNIYIFTLNENYKNLSKKNDIRNSLNNNNNNDNYNNDILNILIIIVIINIVDSTPSSVWIVGDIVGGIGGDIVVGFNEYEFD